VTATQLFTNNAVALLAADIGPTDMSLTVQAGLGAQFPQPTNPGDFFLVTLEPVNPPVSPREILYITGRVGDVLTVGIRGFEGTTPSAWSSITTLVDHRITAFTINQAMLLPADGGGAALNLYAENPQAGFISPSAIGNNAVGIGYAANAGAAKSLSIGEQSQSRIQGGVVQACGRFSTTGDAQTGRYLVRTISTNATPTECFADGHGGSVRLVLVDNSTWTFRITVTAQRQDASNGWAGYELKGVIFRTIGPASVTMQGIVSSEQIGASNQAWKVTASPDPVNGSLKISVTGETGKQIRWLCLVETVEVTD